MENNYGVDRLRYYYIRDYDNRPVITVCLARLGRKISRGLSICSSKDCIVKAEGRRIARNRALRAIHTDVVGDFIDRTEALQTMEKYSHTYECVGFLEYKTDSYPILTEFEKELLGF